MPKSLIFEIEKGLKGGGHEKRGRSWKCNVRDQAGGGRSKAPPTPPPLFPSWHKFDTPWP